MCVDPASAMGGASLALGIGQAVLGNQGAQQDANAQKTYQAQVDANALTARNQTWQQQNTQEIQQGDSASHALFDNSIRALKARATADNSAAENGVQGNSVESVARDFYGQQNRIDTATVENEGMQVQQVQQDKQSAENAYISRTNQPAVRDPSMLGLGLGIAGAAANAYSIYDARNKKPPTQ